MDANDQTFSADNHLWPINCCTIILLQSVLGVSKNLADTFILENPENWVQLQKVKAKCYSWEI